MGQGGRRREGRQATPFGSQLFCPSAVSHPGSGQENQMLSQDEAPDRLSINERTIAVRERKANGKGETYQ